MDISGETRLNLPRDRVWTCLNDPDVLRHAVPDCESLERAGDQMTGVVSARVGPVRARFEGVATLSDIIPPQSCTLTASGKGGLTGFASAAVKVRLSEDGGGTLLRYDAEVRLGGKLAQLGSRLIESTAQLWVERFFSQFAAVVESGAPLPGAQVPRPAKPSRWREAIRKWRARRSAKRPEPSSTAMGLGPTTATAPPSPSPNAEALSSGAPSLSAGDEAPDVQAVLPTGFLDIEVGSGIGLVTINRPERINCLTFAMWQELAQVVRELGTNDAVRCLVIRGAGGHFSSGADVTEFGEVRNTREQVDRYERAVDRVAEAILACKRPVIAAIDGYCFGGGLAIAMPCDFRIATRNAKFRIPAAKLSVVYGLRGTQTLLALVGLTWAKRMLCLGERVDAATARSIGLIDEIIDGDDLAESIAPFVNGILAAAPLTVSGSKAMLNGLAYRTPADLKREAARLIREAGASADYEEGRNAFAEGRPPKFIGR